MNRKAWIGLISVVIVLVIVAAFWVVSRDKSDVVRIGLVSPFSGEGANYGNAARTATDLAVDEINSRGGVGGKKLVVIYEDDRGTPRDAVSAFQKLATVDRVLGVLGPFYSSNVLACAPVAEKEKVVLLTPTATSDNVRDAGEFVFRVCPANDAQSRTIAQFAVESLALKKSFILYRNVDYGVTLRDVFEKEFKALGGTILGAEAVAPEASDVRAQLTKVKAAAPDFVFAAVHYPEGSAILRQVKELGIPTVVIGTDGGYDPELLKRAGDAAEGSYWVTIGWGNEKTNPAVAKFRKAYRERYGEDPGVYSGLFYDATHVLAKAIAGADTLEGPSIQKALLKTVYDGPTGTTKFDAYGDVDKPFSVYRVKDGRFVPVPLGRQ
ncbi:MAG: ABC transporter substrate-binding protein [Candidatus Nealsonbacteria bacterium]|nr:ABC transporter substrate-binding protein [Candidatus Nealsonbacteria bacterium]